MKDKTLKNVIAAMLVFTTGGYTELATAHSQSETLGKPGWANDLYQVNCYDDGSGTGAANKLGMQVRTGTGAPGLKISVRTIKGAVAMNVTDAVNNDSVYSAMNYNVGGAGLYYVSVGKTAASTVPTPYILQFHCTNSSNEHTGTSWVMLQNQ
jgi:hypothetical protein